LIEVIEAVRVFEATKRIPDKYQDTTFFSMNDWWLYFRSDAPNMCHQCDFYGGIYFFAGDKLRGDFPYLEIIDENTIEPHVHPHCGCILLRLFKVPIEF
jgi:hypothetical protein